MNLIMRKKKITIVFLLLLILFLSILADSKDTSNTSIHHVNIITNFQQNSNDYSNQQRQNSGSIKKIQGYIIYKYVSNTKACKKQTISIMTIAKDEYSWGQNRTFVNHLQLLSTISYSLECLSVNVLISSKKMFDTVLNTLPYHLMSKISKITLIYQPSEFPVDRKKRHLDNNHGLQTKRRQYLARTRNQLQYLTLRYEEAVLWIDADIVGFPHYLLTTMIESQKDIIVARCNEHMGAMREYDLNTWTSPVHIRGIKLDHLHAFEKGKERFIEVTSVGASFLYVKSIVIRSGITFTPFYSVGTTWDKPGGDGIESEGICYVARLNGFTCWGMPWIIDTVLHDDFPPL